MVSRAHEYVSRQYVSGERSQMIGGRLITSARGKEVTRTAVAAFATLIGGTALCCVLAQPSLAQSRSDALHSGFISPPLSAKPRVWWHWMNGNITKEGIKLDLEWMRRIGIGGVQIFDANLNTPRLIDKPLVYMSRDWQAAFRYAIRLAGALELETSIASCPGWSESGGPWVTPAQAMKKIVWSEIPLTGGQHFRGKLPKPPSVSGPFQNVPVFDSIAAAFGKQYVEQFPEWYSDIAVIAYRIPEDEAVATPAKITSSVPIDTTILSGGDLVRSTPLPKASMGRQAWIQFQYAKPHAIRAVTLALNDPLESFLAILRTGSSVAELEASKDGRAFFRVAAIPADGAVEHTIAFPAVVAQWFRVVFTTQQRPLPEFFKRQAVSPTWSIAELVLHQGARVNRFEDKAGFANALDLDAFPTPEVDRAAEIASSQIVDLTDRLTADGSLDWDVPAGHWVVMRFGSSLTGATNHPAQKEATGLEVDKLDRESVDSYLTKYLKGYELILGRPLGRHGLQSVISDSYEAGPANWTLRMPEEFKRRRGYDLRPWLPVLAGRVIESSAASDRFLWDYRKTLGELIAESHYEEFSRLLHKRGIGYYGESHESLRAFIGDGMEVKRADDIPMGAMWFQDPNDPREQFGYEADLKESASVAHIYGQNLVAAESMTTTVAPYGWTPASLKPTADREMALGVNRIVIHTSVHQPLSAHAPGLALGPFGQWFTRNETWAEQAKPWITYLSRSCFLLQQGTYIADILYFYGEDSNLTARFRDHAPDLPAGYSFDYINADALIHRLSATGSRLTTPSGMAYRVLVLDPSARQMSLPVLRKISQLVRAGAIVVGAKPEATPSLSDDEQEFHHLTDELWGSGANPTTIAKGSVIEGQRLEHVLRSMDVSPDFEFTGIHPESASLKFVHRQWSGGDLYYIDNATNYRQTVEATFRVVGEEAELWHADTGKIEPANFAVTHGRTKVSLQLEPWETIFVVFRAGSISSSRHLLPETESVLAVVPGPWMVTFQANHGAPARMTVANLTQWNESTDSGVRYFSGTATYTKIVYAPGAWFIPSERLWIDLGDVRDVGEIYLNGRPVGIAWKWPFKLDATDRFRRGNNTLEIRVTNTWVNRIIGDRQPNVDRTYTFTSPPVYEANSPLKPSGLLGPVRILRAASRVAPQAAFPR
jgi:hypothetical protein